MYWAVCASKGSREIVQYNFAISLATYCYEQIANCAYQQPLKGLGQRLVAFECLDLAHHDLNLRSLLT